jgi:tetratricopeptide (TPR) repeat protein
MLLTPPRYIHELGTYEVLEQFLGKSFEVLEQCRIMESEPMLQAKLQMVAGVMWDNWGEFQKSIDCFRQCLEISEKCLEPSDEFLAGVYNDLGNTSESMNLPKIAVDYHNKAWEIRAQNQDPTGETVAHSKSNLARALLMLNEDDEAGEKMDDAGKVFNAASAWFHESQ